MKPKLLKSISVRLPDELLQKIDAKCVASSISRSNLFRTALEERLEPDAQTSFDDIDLPCRPSR
jgi:metal-responsive CopG/Arc/MetJ family transcriptional regulator